MSTATDSSGTNTTTAGESIRRNAAFVTTHWSVVMAAGRNDTPRARAALERLCRTYWYPLYAYVRRSGYSPHDAEDLTQDFFARLFAHQSIARAEPGRGRFRSFLLGALKHALANEYAKRMTRKRGAGRVVSLDLAEAEDRLRFDLVAGDVSPDQLFDRHWALALLDRVLCRLEEEYRRSGKAALFNSLKETLTGTRQAQPYAELGVRLRLQEAAVKVAVHRLRKRYRELLQEEIQETVSSPEEAREELRYLLRMLASPCPVL